ncbi:MAG: alpha-N-arabinofuranosidase, partial [Lachnospiraceae bacterium]|nr:alpha-N-arabinofuranosidase [Lachnospiraceae bacterium]
RTSYARQACAEKLRRRPDGSFLQAEITSCGLNGGPLDSLERYEARIACNLWAKGHQTGRTDGFGSKKRLSDHPYFTQTGKDRENNGNQYIANMRDGACAGFKYFHFNEFETKIQVCLSGSGKGSFLVSDDPDFRTILSEITIHVQGETQGFTGILQVMEGNRPLYFLFSGTGAVNFHTFTMK